MAESFKKRAIAAIEHEPAHGWFYLDYGDESKRSEVLIRRRVLDILGNLPESESEPDEVRTAVLVEMPVGLANWWASHRAFTADDDDVESYFATIVACDEALRKMRAT